MMRSMKISARGFARLKMLEGYREKAYQDQAGVWTIGYGHTAGVVPGAVITKHQAEVFLLEDAADAEAAVNRHVKTQLLQSQFDALAIFALNIGETEFRKSTLVKRVNAGRLDEVPEQLARWNKVTDPTTKRKVVSAGLINRRAAEAALWSETRESVSVEMGHIETAPPAAAAPDMKPLRKSKEVNSSIIGGGGLLAAGGAVVSAIGALDQTAQIVLVGGLIVGLTAFAIIFGNRLIARLNGER